jgi:hypothetical protein
MKYCSALLVWIAGAAIVPWLAVAHAQPAGILPKVTVPLTVQEMLAIYADKTWKWDAGGGRFIAKNRKFIAYSEEGGKLAIGEGRWEVRNGGHLCMVAVWATKDGKSPARSCFKLVRDRGTIYQRREPKGRWFILRTYRPKPEDEFHKLVSDDIVSPKVQTLQALLK